MTVEIIGRACVVPGAGNPEELFDLLKNRRCTVTEIPHDRWDHARYWHPQIGTAGKTYTFAAGVIGDLYAFDANVFGMSQREAMHLDPQQRLVLELAWRALEDASIDHASIRGENIGVYVGASSLDHANLLSEDPAAGGPYFMSGNTLSVVSNRVSHIFGLRGPSLTVDTACSSSLIALDQAVKSLEAGVIDTAIVGGVSILAHPLPFVGFAQARMLSPDGLCRAYDDRGIGYVRSEGGAVFVLRRTDRAIKERDRSYATIVASATNSAGRTNGISLPSRNSQAALLRSIYGENGVDVGQLAFVEGHGTGTKVGDPAELWSIGTEIGQKRSAPLPVGSIKSNIGHTEPASGVLGLMKAVLALEHNYVPASLHFEVPNENIDFDALNVRVASEPIELLKSTRRRYAGVNSFGFGGANAHIVISDPANDQPRPDAVPGRGVFVASAQTTSSLDNLLSSYRDMLSKGSKTQRQNVAAAAGANRTMLKSRFVVNTSEPDAIVHAIDEYLNDRPGAAEVADAPLAEGKVAFVFSGNGSQWAGMGIDAFKQNIHFRQRFTAISALFQLHADVVLSDLLFAEDLGARLADTKIAQPLLFAVQAALADTLVKLGVKPSAVLGHSVGEVAAAYASGAIQLVDAVSIVAKRSFHQDRLAGFGKMAAVMLSANDAMDLAKAEGLDALCVGAFNAQNSVTMTGPADEIEAFRDAARARKIPASVLDINYPFHHPMIDMAQEAFLADLTQISLRPTEVDFISTVTGAKLDGKALDSSYWWRNVREPVLFQSGVEAAIEQGCTVFIEIGPRPVLAAYLRDAVKARGIPGVAIATLAKEPIGQNGDPVGRSLSRAIAHGAAFDAKACLGERNAFVRLPSLPFEKAIVKPARTSDAVALYGRDVDEPYTLAGWRVDPLSGHWKNHVDRHLFPDLAEHVVDGKPILPGSGFIEIALSALRQYHATDTVEVTNLEIMRPLELQATTLTELSTVISPETGDIEIRSRERLSDDDWTLHAVARGRALRDGAIKTATQRPKGSPLRTFTAADAYKTAKRFGLDYGPSFQLMKRAELFEGNVIVATLVAAAKPAHRYVSYGLNPVSVDAAFHGLVALFGEYTGALGGAPYIPVRFGRIRLLKPDAELAGARIDIDRVSEHSIRASFTFFDKAGNAIADASDCRFRRTYLRQHRTLYDTSFHYQALPAIVAGPLANDRVGTLAPAAVTIGENDTTIMLKAAIYRACHDIAVRLADPRHLVMPHSLPENAGLRSHLAYCLFILEQADLARNSERGWVIEPDCELPPLDQILADVVRGDPARAVEAVLVNDAYRETIYRLDSLAAGADIAELNGSFIAEATRSHYDMHGGGAQFRSAALIDALAASLEAATTRPSGQLCVLELESVSTALSRRMADLVRRHGGSLVVAEGRDGARRRLEIEFEKEPRVDVIEPQALASDAGFDIVVSASNALYGLLENSAEYRQRLKSALRQDARLLFMSDAPHALVDFVFGLSDDWFAGSQDPLFPVGRYGGSEDWQRLFKLAGLPSAQVETLQPGSGPVLAVQGQVSDAADAMASVPAADAGAPIIVAGAEAKEAARSFGSGSLHVLTGELDDDIALVDQAVTAAVEQGRALLYLCSKEITEAGSETLLRHTTYLSAVAEAFARLGGEGITPAPRLAVVMPGGAPGGKSGQDAFSASNSGIWTFLRVLKNEYSFIDVTSFDTDGAKIDDALAESITSKLDGKGQDREFVLDATTGAFSRLRAVQGPVTSDVSRTRSFAGATIRQLVASQLGSIVWEEVAHEKIPGPREVVVDVAATGLNFRDVMWGMGLLPEEALEDGFAGATIGMECSGRIAAVGAEVEGFAPGDAVMAIGPAAFSTQMVVDAAGVAPLPPEIDIVSGATLPVAFLTAYYSLVELGRLQPGETVLIHGGAGGVGLAALQVAKQQGARVFATAGTVEKRRYLEMLGVDAVFDSRSLNFVDEVLEATGGEGVDVVLNSLFGDAMELSIGLVRPFGRFLELGKRDYYADSKIGLRPFRRNVSYFGIDADQLLVAKPELTRRLFKDLSVFFARGDFTALPYRQFAFDEIRGAFRLMQGSGHIGKIVITPPASGVDEVRRASGAKMSVDPRGIHLVVGGIGGFGLAAASWLVDMGAKKIALCSRGGRADQETEAAIAAWAEKGVTASVHACDVTDEAQVDHLLQRLRRDAPLKTVVHAAMVLDDALISNLTPSRNRPVIEVKALGASNLDRLTRVDDLDHFILFSSATTLIGNPGQANYVAANGFLEGLARARRAESLPALAIGFGAIGDVGFLSKNEAVGELLAKRIGDSALASHEALELVANYVAQDPGTVDAAAVMISQIDWATAHNLALSKTPLFETVLRSVDQSALAADGGEIDLVAMIAGKSSDDAQQILYDLIAGEIAGILRIPIDSISRNRVLKEIGLDSLMAIEVGLGFQKRTGFEMPLSGVSDTTTVGDIAVKLYDRVQKAAGADDAEEQPAPEGAGLVGSLAQKHIENRQAGTP
ncbi:SDR family NAD(P)-dependent oxidoreductase [Georhizobium profundi]|uniref:SDR family NAD(P)-dependent oxidoreductase n=1 Tax=Georhizobium profundi TaxID=2341112 RepID=A0A3S9B6G7_9HYPH|nr:type I polyketide synthase [Georhizobium profundi]AZN72526.1 SDR family NAD(P)-dependent oxidoreductase [Georhizobium profundi]